MGVNCEVTKMEKVINDRIPHVGEKIFRSVDSDSLIQCLSVSTFRQELAENVILKRWNSKIFEACKSGKTEIVKLLLEHEEIEDINATDQSGGTAFMWACKNGQKDAVELFLNESVYSKHLELNTRDNNGCTGFTLACQNREKDVVKLLLDHSCSKNLEVNAREHDGRTALMSACESGYTDIVKLFLNHSSTKESYLNVQS